MEICCDATSRDAPSFWCWGCDGALFGFGDDFIEGGVAVKRLEVGIGGDAEGGFWLQPSMYSVLQEREGAVGLALEGREASEVVEEAGVARMIGSVDT